MRKLPARIAAALIAATFWYVMINFALLDEASIIPIG